MIYTLISLVGFFAGFIGAADPDAGPNPRAFMTCMTVFNGCFVLRDVFYLVAQHT